MTLSVKEFSSLLELIFQVQRFPLFNFNVKSFYKTIKKLQWFIVMERFFDGIQFIAIIYLTFPFILPRKSETKSLVESRARRHSDWSWVNWTQTAQLNFDFFYWSASSINVLFFVWAFFMFSDAQPRRSRHRITKQWLSHFSWFVCERNAHNGKPLTDESCFFKWI